MSAARAGVLSPGHARDSTNASRFTSRGDLDLANGGEHPNVNNRQVLVVVSCVWLPSFEMLCVYAFLAQSPIHPVLYLIHFVTEGGYL